MPLKLSPPSLISFADIIACSVCASLDSIAPVKKKTKPINRLGMQYLNTRKLKQETHQLEKKWCSNKVAESFMAWQNSLRIYRKALQQARKDYYSVLIEENKDKPTSLFSTVARLTRSHHSIEPCIPRALTCNDFMKFLNNIIILVRENILH